jgi:SAM-dependent methyltransferase
LVNARKVSVPTTLALWWRKQREDRSLSATVRLFIATLREFLRDSLPDRRRQRYGDIDFDWQHRVDTTSATVDWHTRLVGLLNSPYQPIPPEEFREIMESLAIDFSQFTFIDIGSGKGRALLLAADYGFRRIIGVELIPELDQIAQANVRKLQASGLKANIELVCGDATDFSFPAESTVVFLFNPLPERALYCLLTNLERSLHRNPRLVYIAYANPILERIIESCSIFEKVRGMPRYVLFRSKVEQLRQSRS